MHRAIAFLIALGLAFSAIPQARAERATEAEMELVCRNWLSYMVDQQGGWAGEMEPKIVGSQAIIVDGTTVALAFSIAPRGYVVVPVLKDLPPIKAYSDDSELDLDADVGFPQLLRKLLGDRIERFIAEYGSLDARQPADGDVLLGRAHRQQWDRFSVPEAEFHTGPREEGAPRFDEVGPLLTSNWHQRGPYNDYCPLGYEGYQTVVGCVATAAAQLMHYHRFPPQGIGDHTYFWPGDNSCEPGNDGAGELYADFSDPYDWANMPDDCSGGCSAAQQAALAELNYEVGVAYEMDYGACGSGAYTWDAVWLLPMYFGYDDVVVWEERHHHSADSWFWIIQWEINSRRPMLYTFWGSGWGHAIVCDGWRVAGGLNQYHMNYGWADSHTAWYTIDQIAYTNDPLQENLVRNIQANACATRYDVYFGTDDPPTTTICAGIMTPDCDPGPLEPETTYYWQVFADGPTASTMGPVWSFTTGPDCNGNTVPDSVDLDEGTSQDCNGNLIPDECDIADCAGDPACDDCNGNGSPDGCDISSGISLDCHGNGIPDSCELPGDDDGDGDVDLIDFVACVECMTAPCAESPCSAPRYTDPCCAIPDLDHDGDVDLVDVAGFQRICCQ